MKNTSVKVQSLGLIDYKDAWDYQEKVFNEIVQLKMTNRGNETNPEIAQEITPNYLLFCEHPHVYTLGKSGHEDYLLVNKEQLEEIGATYYKINRGGDITYHGPGQIVGYPILDLDNFFTDIHKYLRLLEEVIIKTLAEYGVNAGRYPSYTGVWIDADSPEKARKICAMGVRCSRWVTMHGFALNVNSELNYFNNIIPCGIKDKQVTSLKQEIGKNVDLEEITNKIKHHFSEIFECQLL